VSKTCSNEANIDKHEENVIWADVVLSLKSSLCK